MEQGFIFKQKDKHLQYIQCQYTLKIYKNYGKYRNHNLGAITIDMNFVLKIFLTIPESGKREVVEKNKHRQHPKNYSF